MRGFLAPTDNHNMRIYNTWTLAASIPFAAAAILNVKSILDRSALAWALRSYVAPKLDNADPSEAR